MSTHSDYSLLPGVNWSTLREMKRSPAHYKHRRETPREDTPAMRFGRALHCAVLEPDRFPVEWTLYDGRRAGSAWTEFVTVNAGKSVLTLEDYQRVLDARDAVLAHKAARRLLRNGRTEVTVQWVDPATRIKCKARLDHLRGDVLTDLKTTRDVDARAYGRLAANNGVIEQMAFYRRGLLATGHKDVAVNLVVVEAEAPHDVAVRTLDEDMLWAGDEIVGGLLAEVKRCRRLRRWPGRYPEPEPLAVPPWYYTELDTIEVLS